MSGDTTAKLYWETADCVCLKLKKANGGVTLNEFYDVGPLPDDLTLLDDEGDPIENASFVRIQQHFSIMYEGTRYDFVSPIEGRPEKEPPAVAAPIDMVGPPAAGRSPSTPESMDVSNQLAAIFEGEVNAHLEDYFQSVLPGCKFSRFKSREFDVDNNTARLEMDSFSYMTHDTLESPQTNNVPSIYVVQPNHMRKKKPVGAPRKAANLENLARKYVVGESYAGDRENTIKDKVNQLEEKLEKMKQRHSIQSSEVSDATSIFGAAILSFTCISLPRKDMAQKCMEAVLEKLSSSQTPILWRLAQAERFFILVLSKREGATTCALREITRSIQGVEIRIQAILERLEVFLGRLEAIQGVEMSNERVEMRIQGVEKSNERVEMSFQGVEKSNERVETRIQGVETRIQGIEMGIQAILRRLDEKAGQEGNAQL